ncbi:tetratricopeptide repeat protein [Mariprofundus erugo]|nr:tetratricopeptide repeat protein [Mariprofundus erugo]
MARKSRKQPSTTGKARTHARASAQAHIQSIVTSMNHAQWETAAAQALAMTRLFPSHPYAWTMLGIVYAQTGRLPESLPALQQAVALNPEDAGMHNNLGNAQRQLGRLAEAEVSCRKAVELSPGYADAHNNLANVLQELGRLPEAKAAYRQAIALNPEFAMAYGNLGRLYRAQGELADAESCLRRALKLNPADHELKSLYAQCISTMRFERIHPEIYALTAQALAEAWTRPSELSGLACHLIMLNPDIGMLIRAAHTADPAATMALPPDDALLQALLVSVPVYDDDVERWLTRVRRQLLQHTAGAEEGPAAGRLAFLSALAQQCFINEYLFACSADELQIVSRLQAELAEAIAGGAAMPTPAQLLVVACYTPLASMAGAEALLAQAWPDEVRTVCTMQIAEPLQERELKRSIPSITSIDHGVSLEVQHQYEENPYPRWVRTPLALPPVALDTYLQQLFPHMDIVPVEHIQQPDILVAGCGTGQHPIQSAQLIRGGHVLAIDLSLASLAYAKRKTIEAGIANIEYAQADILKLGSKARSFDLIESCGVLHHLENPFDGWRQLVALLRPNGLMRLAFYSETARRHVVRARELLSSEGFASTPEDIRRARHYLKEVDRSDTLGCAVRSTDFYSLSACRDLLFHVQEHRMTLDVIEHFINEQGLTFLGFELDPPVARAYQARFPEDRALISFENWKQFEQENPDTFFGMYEFWLQKRA